MVVFSPRAPRRQHPSLVQLARTQRKVRVFAPSPPVAAPLDGDQVLGDFGQILTAPPETEAAPETQTTPAPEGANDVSIEEQVGAIDAAYFLALNIAADQAERDHQRAEIARMEAEQVDAYQCGMSCDWSEQIAATQAQIKAIDERLTTSEILAEIAATNLEAAPLSAYERAGIAVAESEAKRLALPFWRYHDARQAETRDYERDCIRHRIADGRAQRHTNQYQREVPCTSGQVQYIEFLAGGASEGRALVDRALTELRVSEATALIQWLKNGRPDA